VISAMRTPFVVVDVERGFPVAWARNVRPPALARGLRLYA
jgi:hypothetical protein